MAKSKSDIQPSAMSAINFWTDQCEDMWDELRSVPDPMQYLNSRIDACKYGRSTFTRRMAASLLAPYHFRDVYIKRSFTVGASSKKLPYAYRNVPNMAWEEYFQWLHRTEDFRSMLLRIRIGIQSIASEHTRQGSPIAEAVLVARMRLTLAYAMGPCPQIDVVHTATAAGILVIVAGTESDPIVIADLSADYQMELLALTTAHEQPPSSEKDTDNV